ncbi:MAG: hypothetical protein PVG39_00785 [Desulfobacteraceae bacterium]|jgi:hypothetical protein
MQILDFFYWWKPGGGDTVSYLLRATGASKTAEDGTINYTETDGSIAASGGVYSVTAQTTPAWGDLGWVSNDLNAVAGRGFGFTLNGSSITTQQLLAGWSDNGIGTANIMLGIQIDGSGNVKLVINGTVGPIIGTVSNNTDEKFYIIKGGYDSNGVPMDAATNISSYPYGGSIYWHNGTNWILLYRSKDIIDTGMDYPAMSFYDYGGTYDNIRVHNVDLSSVLVPVFLDTCTDTNGTSLDAHDPDVDTEGGGWTVQNGSWEIQSNRAYSATALSIASIDAGVSDVWGETVAQVVSPISGFHLLCRYSNNSNYWFVNASSSGDEIAIYEVNGGTTTKRASTSVTVNGSTDYRLTVVCNGQTIAGYLDGSTKVSYASAVLNETATLFGLRRSNDSNVQTHELVALKPAGTGGEYSQLDTY